MRNLQFYVSGKRPMGHGIHNILNYLRAFMPGILHRFYSFSMYFLVYLITLNFIWTMLQMFQQWPRLEKNHSTIMLTVVMWRRVTARFVTRFNLWLRHDLWPQNASICDPARFVTKSASICDQRYTMILESKLCRGKLVFVFTLIMNATWYNMMHIYIWTVL